MKKNDKIHISISSEDKIKLQKKAESLAMTLSDYSRLVLLHSLQGQLTFNNP